MDFYEIMLQQKLAGGGGGGSWTVLTEESVTTSAQSGSYNARLLYLQPISANTIRVTFNGTEYECERQAMGDFFIYGASVDEQTGAFDWSEYPFCITSNSGNYPPNEIYTETAGTYTIKIEAPGGGGGDVSVESLDVTENGTYTASSGHAYSPVTVNVPSVTPTGNINITSTAQTDVSAYATAQVVDSDLIASNIKKDVNILGVIGTYEGDSGSDFDVAGLIDESITSAVIPEGTTKIGMYTFCGRKSLVNVQIPNSVTSIGMYAFDGCNLTTVTIPHNVTSIGNAAFRTNPLKSITIKAIEPPTLGNFAFYDVPSTFNIYVPAESVDTYKSASNWSNYTSNIQAISE